MQTSTDRMLTRIKSIYLYIKQKGTVTTNELVEEFGITQRTVQRDLNVLEYNNLVVSSARGKWKATSKKNKGFIIKKTISGLFFDFCWLIDILPATIHGIHHEKVLRPTTALQCALFQVQELAFLLLRTCALLDGTSLLTPLHERGNGLLPLKFPNVLVLSYSRLLALALYEKPLHLLLLHTLLLLPDTVYRHVFFGAIN